MQVRQIFGGIGQACVRGRWLVVVVWVAVTAGAVSELPALSSVTQGSNSTFLPADAPSQQATELMKVFGDTDLVQVPVLIGRSGGRLTAGDVAAVTGLRTQFRRVRQVTAVQDGGRSADGAAERLMVLVPSGQLQGQGVVDLVDALRTGIADSSLPAGLTAHVSGPLAVQADQAVASGTQGNQVEQLSSLFIVVLLVLIFGSLTLSLTTLVPSFLAVVVSGPLVAEAARHGLQVSPIAQFLLIVLVLGAGTDYGLFLVFRLREELARHGHDQVGARASGSSTLAGSMARDLLRARDPARLALVASVGMVGESVAASAGTVIVAMLTLLLAQFPFYADLGLPFAIAVTVTLLANLTLLPALLSIRLSLLAAKRSLFQTWFGRPKLLPWSLRRSGRAGVWSRLSGRVVQHPLATLMAGLVLFGGLSVAALGYRSGGFGGDTAPPAGSDSAAGQTMLRQHFPETAADPTLVVMSFSTPVWRDPAPLAEATRMLSRSAVFTTVTGPLNPVGPALAPASYARLYRVLGPAARLPPAPPARSTVTAAVYQQYRSTSSFVSNDGRTVLFATGLAAGDPSGTTALNAVPAIRAAVAAAARSAGASQAGVAGTAPGLRDISDVSASDLWRVIPVAVAAIGILLALVLRSLVAPLYLIVSVGISYLAALGLAVLVFVHLAGGSGLVFFMPFLMFVFLLALGEDYNILIMTRIREESQHLPLHEAVVTALRSTGTAISSAGLVLAGSFLVLVLAAGTGTGSDQVRNIGLGLTFGILMDTFLVRTLLVPSTVVMLGRWNWWPSRLARPPAGQPAARAVPISPDPGRRPADPPSPSHATGEGPAIGSDNRLGIPPAPARGTSAPATAAPQPGHQAPGLVDHE